jgi:hypothetical protein
MIIKDTKRLGLAYQENPNHYVRDVINLIT